MRHVVPFARPRIVAVAGGAALFALITAGCAAKADPIATAPTEAPTTTIPATTTGAPTTPAPTTTAPAIPTWPLTGQAADATAMNIPVMAVKVDNSPWARPHAGINQADQVYELQVEGITRFMELFHSQQPDRIGPVRSARSSDIDIFGNLHRPLLVWSGGNPGVTQEVADADANGVVHDIGFEGIGKPDFYRDNANGKQAPHNLYTSVAKLRADFTPPDAAPPAPMFTFRAPGAALPATAVDAPGVTIDFGRGVRIEYVWDDERKGWDRFQVDELHSRAQSSFKDEEGVQVAPDNVVILYLSYAPDPVDGRSPKANSVGDGPGIVLTQGKAINVHWSRADAGDGWHLVDEQTGAPVDLTVGRTWVALPQQGEDQVIPIDGDQAAQLLTLR